MGVDDKHEFVKVRRACANPLTEVKVLLNICANGSRSSGNMPVLLARRSMIRDFVRASIQKVKWSPRTLIVLVVKVMGEGVY